MSQSSKDISKDIADEANQWLFHESSLEENEKRLAGYKNKLAELQIEKKAAGKSSSQLVAGEAELKAKISETNKAIQLQKQELFSAAGSIDQLKARAAILTQQYNSMSEAARRSVAGQEITAELKKTNQALITSGEAIEDHRRKVGNYTGGIQKAFQGLWTGLRQLANFIPGLGLAGLIGVIIDMIVDFVAKSKLFKDSISALEQKQRIYQPLLKGGRWICGAA